MGEQKTLSELAAIVNPGMTYWKHPSEMILWTPNVTGTCNITCFINYTYYVACIINYRNMFLGCGSPGPTESRGRLQLPAAQPLGPSSGCSSNDLAGKDTCPQFPQCG